MISHHGSRQAIATTIRGGLSKAGSIVGFCLLLACTSWILDRAAIRIQLFTFDWSYGFRVSAILSMLLLFNRAVLAAVITLTLAVALYS